MFRMTTLVLAVLFASPAVAAEPAKDTSPSYKPMKVVLDDDGDQWVRFITWHQIWARGAQLNPDTEVQGRERSFATDLAIRRSRLMVVAQPFPKTQFVFHAGINNQTFNNARKPQLYIHGAWASQRLTDNGLLTVGAGLHYWHGVSRLANASTLNFLALDAPISNWPTIERTDQFARMLGIFAKGHTGKLAYRVALNKPFSTSQTLVENGPSDYNSEADSLSTTGYVELQLDDKESDLLPFKVGTYLGKKKVVNVGAGWLWHPNAMATLDGDGERRATDLTALGVDAFVDQPIGPNGAAVTAYAGYWYYDFGPDHVRNIGIMNLGTGGSSGNGAGNAYPVLGTGHHVYSQVGVLLPGDYGGVQIQPYVTTQLSLIDALGAPMVAPEAGVNWFIHGHHLKVTTHWRNRPIFEVGDAPEVEGRANEVITQLAVFL